jgi:ribosomal protein L18E
MSKEIEIEKLLKRYKKLSDPNKAALDEIISVINRDVDWRLRIQARDRQRLEIQKGDKTNGLLEI